MTKRAHDPEGGPTVDQEETLFGPGRAPQVPVPAAEQWREKMGMIGALIASGRAHSRKAHAAPCPNCRAMVVRGYDGDLCAEYAVVDPTPLDADDELACKLAGRKLYLARVRGDRVELDYRDEWATPGTATRPVLPEHKCGYRFTD